MASLNDLMHRFYEKFFKSGDRIPVDVGGQYVILSTDPKPELDPDDRAFLLEQDTGTIYYWNGSEWVEG